VIVYDLKCEKNHKFEGWFINRDSYEEQKREKLISCPVCGGTEIEMVLTATAIRGRDKGDAQPRVNGDPRDISPGKALEMLNKFIDENFLDVGEKFAEVALKIHSGDEEGCNIRGTVTKSEEVVLREEGVEFFKIPSWKFDS